MNSMQPGRWAVRTNLVAGLALALLLGACSGPQERKSEKETEARKVATLNTQMGQEYMNRGQLEIALEKLKKAINADPEYAPAHTVLAVLYERLGERESAGRHYEAAVKAAPDSGDANNNYGAFLCRTGAGQGAHKYFDRAIEDPFYRTPAVAMANAGACEMTLGNVDKAESYLRKSLQFDPGFPGALLDMADLACKQESWMQCRAFLQRYEATGQVSAAGLALGYEAELHTGNRAEAGRYRDRLIDEFPASPEAKELQGLN